MKLIYIGKNRKKGISGIIASLVLVIVFISTVTVTLYIENQTFNGLNTVSKQLLNTPSTLIELPGDQVYSNRPVSIKYVIYPNGQIQEENLKITSTPMDISGVLGGFGWALLVTSDGQSFNISNIKLLSDANSAYFGLNLPPGSMIGGYSIDYNGNLFYYIPGQYQAGDEIPSSLQSYVSSQFTNFDPTNTVSTGLSYTYSHQFLYGALFNSSILFPFYNGSSLTFGITWILGDLQEKGLTFTAVTPYATFCSVPLENYMDMGYFSLPLSLNILSPQGNEYIWIEYHSYSYSTLFYDRFLNIYGASNLMDNPDIGYFVVNVNGYVGRAESQIFPNGITLTILDTPKGIEFLANGKPILFNEIQGYGKTLYDTAFFPVHLIHGEAVVNLPAGTPVNYGNYEINGRPVILLSSLQLGSSIALNPPNGTVIQLGTGCISEINTGVYDQLFGEYLYFYKVNVTLDSTFGTDVLAEPVDFSGNQYYIGYWNAFSLEDQPLIIQPGIHTYTFYFGATEGEASLNKNEIYTISLPLSMGTNLYLNVNAT
ncbi:hypothetical protein GWK48_01735 [Metallosphaera tengchongensis]|uniref:Uncharacterized protein n=1 Tax=Metallosphaera tengchongensis TaxID=1532350 RepID=A0A6N0NSW9_9CREN|nr:hypothetical protein [Metallosphaera tengchongensis]QKQ99284.1 hypothetical protein GWK48_01735 [Metallosphaera tengchongensis]